MAEILVGVAQLAFIVFMAVLYAVSPKKFGADAPFAPVPWVLSAYALFTLPATELALKHVGRAVPNVPLLAAFAALTGVVKLESVVAAIRDKFAGKVGEGNVAAATAAFDLVRKEQEGLHA